MKRLPQIAEGADGLGRPTIMDPALAQDHGVRYVHLAVLAIDVDRVSEHAPAEDTLPMGWEVFLTEYALLAELGESNAAELELIEDLCASALEDRGNERVLGSQLSFAVYDAMERGALPRSLEPLFEHWRAPPKQLLSELAPLWTDAEASARKCALHCLAQRLDPPLAEPTLEALQELADATLGDPD